MNAYSKIRTVTAGLLVALAMIVVPTAFAAGKPDDEHRQLGTPMAADVQYGIPRPTPSHYAEAGVSLGRPSGVPRTMPSDYTAAGVSVGSGSSSVDVPQAASATGFDWGDAALGAGASSALLLTAIAAWALAARRRSDPPSGVGASVVQH